MTIILYQLELKLMDPGALKASNSSKQLEQKIKLSPWPYREEMQAVYWAQFPIWKAWRKYLNLSQPNLIQMEKDTHPKWKKMSNINIYDYYIFYFFVLFSFLIRYFD